MTISISTVINGKMNVPNITCLTTDVIGGAVSGANPGNVIYVSDSQLWYIVRYDGQLVPYALPVEITLDPGNITIGEVEIHQPVADAVSLSPHYGTQSVGTSGVAQPLVSSATYAISLLVFPKPANTSSIYFGTSAVNKITSKQIVIAPSTGVVSIDAPIGYKLGVNTFFVDSDVNGEGVNFMYLG